MEYLLSASSCSGPWTYKLKTHLLCCSGVLTNGRRVNEEVQNETLHLHYSSCTLAFSLHCLCFPNYWPQYCKRNAELDRVGGGTLIQPWTEPRPSCRTGPGGLCLASTGTHQVKTSPGFPTTSQVGTMIR